MSCLQGEFCGIELIRFSGDRSAMAVIGSDNLGSWRCAVVAHRGLWKWTSIENSADAFARAAAAGFVSECDVWLSVDAVPVVFHDDTVERLTGGQGLVTSFTAAQLQSMRLRHPLLSACIPTLAEVRHNVSYVEIKQPDSPELVGRVIDLMRGRDWLLQSFDPANLRHALAIDPSTSVALLVDQERNLDLAMDRRWRVHLDQALLDDRTAGRLHDGGAPMGVWTVNDDEAIDRVLRYRPVAIISDEPDLVRRRMALAGGVEA